MSKKNVVGVAVIILVMVSVVYVGVNRFMKKRPPEFQGLSKNTVFDVKWKTVEGKWFAGNASCIKLDENTEPMLVSAYHLFSDEAVFGEKDSGYQANVMGYVTGGKLYDIMELDMAGFSLGSIDMENGYKNVKAAGEVERPLLVKDAVSLHNDVAAYALKDSTQVTPLVMSPEDCEEGDFVYVVGTSFREANQKTDHTYRGVVSGVSDGMMTINMEEAIDFYGCSGCPIVNEKGEFVGMLLSSSFDNSIVFSNSTGVIRKALEEAAGSL